MMVDEKMRALVCAYMSSSDHICSPHRRPFYSSLAAAFPDRVKLPDQPAVLNINMSGEGKYAFVELRDEDMASAALQLNGLDLCGRPLACGKFAQRSSSSAIAVI